MVAKPIAVVALAALCLLGAACSSVSTQEGSRVLPETADNSDSSSQPTDTGTNESTAPAEREPAFESPTPGDDPSDAQPGDDATSDSDRGGRNLGSDDASLDDAEQEPPSDEAAATPTPPTPEPVPAEPSDADTPEAETADAEPPASAEPTETPVATTAPLPTVAPLATAAPVVAVQPTTTPIPEPVVEAQVPTGPLPSDDIVVEGPAVDESLPVGISNNGASACASAESAIEFLDFGDTNRMAGALAEAAQFAGQASEPELVALAPELAAAGNDPEAAISTIIATLGACAVYGYQV